MVEECLDWRLNTFCVANYGLLQRRKLSRLGSDWVFESANSIFLIIDFSLLCFNSFIGFFEFFPEPLIVTLVLNQLVEHFRHVLLGGTLHLLFHLQLVLQFDDLELHVPHYDFVLPVRLHLVEPLAFHYRRVEVLYELLGLSVNFLNWHVIPQSFILILGRASEFLLCLEWLNCHWLCPPIILHLLQQHFVGCSLKFQPIVLDF